jgi:NAD(P)-dependent dehydrogenase (short-subunit alcohol dehydrogenase family)
MLNHSIERIAGKTLDARKAVEEKYLGMIAAGRIGNPSEAGEAIAWLCSDAASYVTGHSMIVDGGFTAAFR